MTGFELRISGFKRDHFNNCATTTAYSYNGVYFTSESIELNFHLVTHKLRIIIIRHRHWNFEIM